MDTVTLSAQTIQSLLNYLSKQPYNEVVHLIDKIVNEAKNYSKTKPVDTKDNEHDSM